MPETIFLFFMGSFFALLTIREVKHGFVYARGMKKMKKSEYPRAFKFIITLQIIASASLFLMSGVAFERFVK